jgi:predicted dehydrogenase
MTFAGAGERVVRWGVLATGGIAAAFTKDVQELEGSEVVAVASRDTASAQAFADRFSIPRAYGDWAALGADRDVDVVYVATPHSAHRAAAGGALAAGKAVLCEKPLTLNLREAQELVALAREHGVFLMEAMWTYCNPVVRRAAELVRDGAIGEVRSVHADFGVQGPGGLPFPPEHRMVNPALGGGALLDLGVYPVSFAQLLLGEPDRIRGEAVLTPEGVDLVTGVLLGWDSGAVAVLSCSADGQTPTTATVSGTRGTIELPPGFFNPDHFVLRRPGREPEKVTVDHPLRGMQHEAAEVARCVRAGEHESPLVPLAGTLAVMRTLDTVRARLGVQYPADTL